MRFCPKCRSIYAADIDHCGIDGARLVEGDADPLLGRTVDRYRIQDVIAHGAMGSVYRVEHTVLQHEYAMKVLFGDLGASRSLVDRFRLEAKAASEVRHPNVVSVVDFGTTETRLSFLVMEYIPGETLASVIQREAPFSPMRAAKITREIAAGLGAAHQMGLVHRDVKPSNIMLSQQEGFEFAKILDFSIVSRLVRERGSDQLTETGFMVGTPLYMAPEQAAEASSVGPAADLYSLGVILYEMLTGKPPFVGKSAMEVVFKHTTEPVPAMPPAAGLEFLTRWLLEKSPAKRPATAEEVVAELDRLNTSRETDDRSKVPFSGLSSTVEMTLDDAWKGDPPTIEDVQIKDPRSKP